MSKWKIFNRSKEKKVVSTEIEMRLKNVEEYQEKLKTFEMNEESNTLPIKEFNETLYSNDLNQKKPVTMPSEKKQPLKRFSWENLGTIEYNVDGIEDKKTEASGIIKQASDGINQKVDRILYKKNIRR